MEFHNRIDQLNEFMDEYNFPAELRQKLRMYFMESKHLQRHLTYVNGALIPREAEAINTHTNFHS